MVKNNKERKVRSTSEMKQILGEKEADFRILKICLKGKHFLLKIKILDCGCVFQMNHLINETVCCKINVFPSLCQKTDSVDFTIKLRGVAGFANSCLAR